MYTMTAYQKQVFERNKEIGEIGAGTYMCGYRPVASQQRAQRQIGSSHVSLLVSGLSMQVNASIMVNVPLGLEKEVGS